MLFRAGDRQVPFYVVLDGAVQIVREDPSDPVVLVTHGARRFLGELSMLTGQRAYLTARVSQAGRVLVIAPDDFRRLGSEMPEVADAIFRTFVARRDFLRRGEAARAIRIIGSRYSAEALALRAFAARNRLVHTWIDLEDVEDPDVLLAGLGRPRPRHPRGGHAHRRAAPPHARRVRRAPRPHLPPHARASSSTWWSWAPVRPVWRPRCTAPPRA